MESLRDYGKTRSTLSALEIIAWILILVGSVLAFAGFASGGPYQMFERGQPPALMRIVSMLPGVSIAVSGLFTLVMALVGGATVDIAENTQESLRISRETASAALRPPARPGLFERAAEASPAHARPPAPETVDTDLERMDRYQAPSTAEDYRGYKIVQRYNGLYVGKSWFPDLAAAKAFIDQVERDKTPRF